MKEKILEICINNQKFVSLFKDAKGTVYELIQMYSSETRFYHDVSHLCYFVEKIAELNLPENEEALFLTGALFHDCVYEATRDDNEKESLKKFLEKASLFTLEEKDYVSRLILCTEQRERPESPDELLFWEIDNKILKQSFEILLDYERKIFKEYQFVPLKIYIEKRCEFLEKAAEYFQNPELKLLSSYVKSKEYTVGVYAGSFDPFHVGHMNILTKAEELFDKVILVWGKNPEKISKVRIPKRVQNREIVIHEGLLTDLLEKIEKENSCKTCLVRGIRNGKDLDYESNQLFFLRSLKKDLNVCYIPCEKEFEHVSSSAVRSLEKMPEASHLLKSLTVE